MKQPSDDIEIQISRHARKRAHQRAGWPLPAVERMARKALDGGVAPSGCDRPELKIFLHSRSVPMSRSQVRVYGGFVFVFQEMDTDEPRILLVTLFGLPRILRRFARWPRRSRNHPQSLSPATHG